MQRLPLKLLDAGMFVARPVVSDTGITLVKENTELTEQLINRLENMHVSTVYVRGTPVQLKDYLPKTLEQRLKDLDIGFSLTPDDSTMQKLRVLLKAHFINRERRTREEEASMPTGAEPPDNPTSRTDKAQ